jgi:hypothetical protein
MLCPEAGRRFRGTIGQDNHGLPEGRTVDVHYYPKEGHGFAKREDQIDALKRVTEWFDEYLKAGRAK